MAEGLRGRAHLLRLTAWGSRRRRSPCVPARRGYRARAGAATAHARCLGGDARPDAAAGGVAPADDATPARRAHRAHLAACWRCPRGRTVLLGCERPAALLPTAARAPDLLAGAANSRRHSGRAPPPCPSPRARRDLARAHATLRDRRSMSCRCAAAGRRRRAEAAPHAGRRRRRAPWRESPPATAERRPRRRQPRGARRPGARGPALRLRRCSGRPSARAFAGGWATRAAGVPSTALGTGGRCWRVRSRRAELRLMDVDPAARRRGPRPVGPGLRGVRAARPAPVPLLLGEPCRPEGGGGGPHAPRRAGAARRRARLATRGGRARRAAHRVIVVGSTTSPAELDEALLRAGRPSARSASARRRPPDVACSQRQLLALGARSAPRGRRSHLQPRSAVASCGQRAALGARRAPRGHNF